MPRKESRTHTSIWNDADFRALTGDAQRVYWLLYSQPNISLCGVVAFTPRRWVGFCSDWTEERFTAALDELHACRFVLIDLDTQELLVRSFMRSDGVTPKSTKIWRPAMQQAEAVISPRIRDAIRHEVDRIEGLDTPSDTPSTRTDSSGGYPPRDAHAAPTPSPAPTPTPASAVVASLDSPTPTPTCEISTSTFRNARGRDELEATR